MPNWCYNTVTFEHDDPAMIARVVKATNEDALLNEFVPMPEELRSTTSPSTPNGELIKKYGASNRYSWSVDNWSTTWEVSEAWVDYEEPNAVSVSFNTAWSPPIQFYHRMRELGFSIDAAYTEEGMGFAGIYQDGEDLCVDLSDIYDAEDPQKLIDTIENEDLRYIVQLALYCTVGV